MSSSNPKLRALGALAVIVGLALVVSCRGFFVKATLQSIALQPQTPSFGIGFQQAMQAWGTDSNNNRYQLTNGVTWSLSDPSTGSVATINTSSGTMTGVNAGTVTVSASYQALTGTTTATVVEIVSSMTITPSSASATVDGTPGYGSFTIKDQSGNDITSLVTLTAELNGADESSEVPCGFELGLAGDGTQDCVPNTTVTTTTLFTIVVTYSGYTGTAAVTATLNVTPAPTALLAPLQDAGGLQLAGAGKPPEVRGQ
jgi:hypothetical protein